MIPFLIGLTDFLRPAEPFDRIFTLLLFDRTDNKSAQIFVGDRDDRNPSALSNSGGKRFSVDLQANMLYRIKRAFVCDPFCGGGRISRRFYYEVRLFRASHCLTHHRCAANEPSRLCAQPQRVQRFGACSYLVIHLHAPSDPSPSSRRPPRERCN